MARIISYSDAEIIALQALKFIASQKSLLDSFSASTGISLTALHARAGEKDVWVAVLQWLLQNESALLMFCANSAHAPDTIHLVVHSLENISG